MKHQVYTCTTCGDLEHEDKGLSYNDKFFCSLICKLKEEEKETLELEKKVYAFRTKGEQ